MSYQSVNMDQVFKSLADSTRRDILQRLVNQELSISDIAKPYDLTYAAVSKHLKVLEDAKLIHRRKEGRKFLIQTNLEPIKQIDDWISFYRQYWQQAFDNLDNYLAKLQENKHNE